MTSPQVLEAIKSAGYTKPSPIQEETVPYLMEGHDMIGQAETGSGKTAAFAWPILSRLDLNTKKPQVLILAPTRELAIQVTTNFQKYAAKIPDFRATTIYGGQNYETQFRALKRGAHVVVGTPGRVIDHLSRGTLDLSDLKVFVLDEADEMLRMGFIDDIERVLEATPRTQQTVFFSATMPPQIRRIADNYLRDPVHIEIQSNSATADSITQSFIMVEPRQKMQRLARFMETEETDGVLIFVKTRNTTNVVAENLIQKGIVASSLNGDIPQNQRERTVSQLKSGKIDVVVATDVAARGLDVSRISHVINYDFPHDTEAYVHRIGRTGRAGREGNAVLFVEPKEKGKLHRLQRATNQKIDAFQQKSLKEINDIRVNKFKQRIIDAADEKSFGFFAELITSFAEESELPMETIAAGLAVMAQGDAPLLLEALKTPKSNWKKDRDNKGKRNDGPMQTFRVEVGRNDGVGPGNLVGAITNEANLTNADIGRIQLFDSFSTVDLPADLPADLVSHLGEVYVNGRPLQITRSDEKYDDHRGGGRGGRDHRGGGGRGRGRDNARGRHQGGGGGRREGGYRDSGPRGRGRDNASGAGRRDRSERGGSYSESRGRRDDRGARSDRPSRDDRGPRSDRPSRDDRGGRGDRPSRDSRPSFGGRGDRNERGRDDRPARRSEGGGGRPRSDRDGDFRGRRDSERGGDRRETRSGDDKPKRKKTKAALRTQQKRKPDAKMTTPFKKYVKIRSAKKK